MLARGCHRPKEAPPGAELPSTAPQLILLECSATGPATAAKRKQTEAFVFLVQSAATASPASRAGAAVALTLAAVVPAALLVVVTPGTWAAARHPGAGTDSALAALAVAVGWLIVGRLVVTAAAVGVAGLPGVVGRSARAAATAWSPVMVRGLVRAALGAAVATGPVLAQGTALADQPGYPTLDRVVSSPAATSPHEPVGTPGSAGGADRQGQGGSAGSGHVVVVRPGDSLWKIAAEHLPSPCSDQQVAVAWPAWYAANRSSIGPDPGQIRPGTRLTPPPGVT